MKVEQLQKNGENIAPITSIKAVRDADGNTVETLLDSKINEPASDGTSGQVLTTDGNGNRSWTTPQTGSADVFVAEYDVTSYDAVVAAINAGKIVLAHCTNEPWEDYTGYVGYYNMVYYSEDEQRILFAKGYEMYYGTYNYGFITIEVVYNESDGFIWQDGYNFMLPSSSWDPSNMTIKNKASLTSDNGIMPKCFYELYTLSSGESLTIKYAAYTEYQEYKIHFKTGTTAPTIIWNMSSLKWAGGEAPTFEANSEYEISILGNRAVCVKFA